LSRHNFDVQVLCVETISRGTETDVSAYDEMDERVRVRRLNITLGPGQDVREWYYAPALEEQCEKLIDAWQPDLVHLVSGYLMGAAPLNPGLRSCDPWSHDLA
jgi:acetoin utilization deacetylase AcuC-like enzyme